MCLQFWIQVPMNYPKNNLCYIDESTVSFGGSYYWYPNQDTYIVADAAALNLFTCRLRSICLFSAQANHEDPWEWWNTLFTLCSQNKKLGVGELIGLCLLQYILNCAKWTNQIAR